MSEWVLLAGVLILCCVGGPLLLAAKALHLGRGVKAEGKAELKGTSFSVVVVVPGAVEQPKDPPCRLPE